MNRSPQIRAVAFAFVLLLATGVAAIPAAAAPPMTQELQSAITPAESLRRLKEGNARFAAGKSIHRDFPARVQETGSGQFPFAVILGCVDSRVPPEMIFDQGIGDLFSARVAGNFVDPSLLGSIEFTTRIAGAKLIFVLGHTECGAVKGACDDVKMGNLTTTLSFIRPAVESVQGIEGPRSSKNPAFVAAVTDANVKLTMEAIRKQSPIIDEMVSKGEVAIAGGVYDVKTGALTFFD
jgi:carbonic anhydrase